MATSDEAFLAEVETFLSSCALPQEEGPPTCSSTIATERVAAIGSQRPSQALKTRVKMDAAAKRDLQRAKDRERRSSYRERRRIERESLQQEIEQLTKELQTAQDETNFYASAWKILAERQRVARMNAEAEQRQLCESIDTQGAILQQFQALVDEHLAGLCDDRDSSPYEHKRVRLEPSDDEVFAVYIDELAEIYAQTDEVLRSGGLDVTEANWDEPTEVFITDPDTGYFLFRGKITLPFDFQDICRSPWCMAPLRHRNESRQIFQGVDDPENTMALKFRITTSFNSQVASVVQRLVLRRYQESKRMVIVWRLFTEGEGSFTGMHADETGWGVVAPVRNSPKAGSVMTHCVRNVPMHLSSAATRGPLVKQFAGKLVEWGSENHSKVMSELKNLRIYEA